MAFSFHWLLTSPHLEVQRTNVKYLNFSTVIIINPRFFNHCPLLEPVCPITFVGLSKIASCNCISELYWYQVVSFSPNVDLIAKTHPIDTLQLRKWENKSNVTGKTLIARIKYVTEKVQILTHYTSNNFYKPFTSYFLSVGFIKISK